MNKKCIFELKHQYDLRNCYSSVRVEQDMWYVRYIQRIPSTSKIPQFDRVYVVRLVDQQYLLCDTCQMYQWMGIPCRHIIHIIDNIDFDAKYIPIQYHRKYLIYADQSKCSQISENIKLAKKVQYPGPPLSTELVDERKEYPYNWRGPSHPV